MPHVKKAELIDGVVRMTFGRWGVLTVTLLLGGNLLRLPAAAPPPDADGTALEKPLLLSVRLPEGDFEVLFQPGIAFDQTVFSQGTQGTIRTKGTIRGMLYLKNNQYVGKLTVEFKSISWEFGSVKFELDRPQYLGASMWLFSTSRERRTTPPAEHH
jgi:hypothetical protein